jgi:hypothetical protein
MKKPAKTDGDLDTWLRVGGLDDEKYKAQNLHEFLSQASGKKSQGRWDSMAGWGYW